ncbi:MAG: cellulase family glycosylhydrolase [Candidatus Omnitrophica bacterium]|nr:cellulase family glycosylhydrolase [Candidatus Omnitrophota bacterium]
MDEDNPFGVLEFLHWAHPWNHNKYTNPEDLLKAIALIRDAGIGWIRMDFLWEDIQPRNGESNFSRYDTIVELVYRSKINILGILNYTAPWASSTGKWNAPPKENKYFVEYAQSVITRYRSQISHWEVWNEPDSSIYWSAQDGLKGYCVLLKEVYNAAKAVNPSCTILNGGLANGAPSVRLLYKNGAQEYFDILNIHIFENPFYSYAPQAVASHISLAAEIMGNYDDTGKRIWVTETGCPGIPKGQESTAQWWLGENPDEEAQSRWVRTAFETLFSHVQVEKVFWAFFRDCQDHWHDGIDYLGLVRGDFSLKPSFEAYKRFIAQFRRI